MKAKFRLLVISVLAVAMLTAMTACGNGNGSGDSEKSSGSSADAVTTASIVNDADALVKALSKDGTWIVATLGDLKVDQDIVVEGEFHDKGDASKEIYRKLALYTQDENHKITESFKLTAPKMTVKSENFKIQGGTFVGDVYVEAKGFTLDKSATVDGNIIYTSDEFKNAATVDGKVTGKTSVDAVTSASIVNDADALVDGLSKDGTWMVATLGNITVDKDIVVEGEFHDKNDPSADIYRKLALYTQDENRKITDSFTLTAPKLIVKSENFRLQGGTFKGDVYVEANGFNVHKTAKIDGNVYYANDAIQKSAKIEGEVSGSQEVK
ncbi:polymer-forming cytoskeletal protein [Sporolactobacillus sp. THM19-2]|uniref:polymer-forming cytoskeletal protein n=1 Tax=Sporolactobacillus sp. THM19-2 TaxID=2511171 RepID=UPI001F0DBAD8|nr:polymer-forming cytoskeletal protein [Sporolactobacillus sp. THM19-2]